MPSLNPYLTFGGNCREALDFYREVLGGELDLLLVKDSPVADQMPPGYGEAILHGELRTAGLTIMASDMTPEPLNDGNGNHMALIFTDEQEARHIFNRLSEGGTVLQPLHEMFFGIIGTFRDKFGKNWLVECSKAGS